MNRHSAVVLQGPGALEEASKGKTGANPAGTVTEETEELRRQRNRSELEDLRGQELPEVEKLEIHNPRRYFEKTSQVWFKPQFRLISFTACNHYFSRTEAYQANPYLFKAIRLFNIRF